MLPEWGKYLVMGIALALGPDVHLPVFVHLHHFGDLHQRTHFVQLIIDDGRDAKRFTLRIAFIHQLLIPGLEDMQVHRFARIDYDAQGKYRNKIRHVLMVGTHHPRCKFNDAYSIR